MTKSSPIEEYYAAYYAGMQFERLGLFAVLKEKYACRTVLYPGCSAHVTPSFFFPHVVYVDASETAQKCFADHASVTRLVERNKKYKETAYIRFLQQDYTTRLPVREESFDLLLSLYAPGIALACKSYLKAGGILLTNNHQDDAGQAAADGGYELIAVVTEKGSKFRWSDRDLGQYFIQKNSNGPKTYRQQVSRWPEYTRQADYYVFRKKK